MLLAWKQKKINTISRRSREFDLKTLSADDLYLRKIIAPNTRVNTVIILSNFPNVFRASLYATHGREMRGGGGNIILF